MSSAPYVYDATGEIAWDKMWNNFCVLAKEGGPPHRGNLLHFKTPNDSATPAYQAAVKEITRAYRLLVPYRTSTAPEGHLQIHLYSTHMAGWFKEVIVLENVECRQLGKYIILPINDDFTSSEIKNVVTVLAKAHHYWQNHRTWFARLMIHLTGKDMEAGLWE